MKIEHRIARDNLGETDDQYAREYVAALTTALRAEYPEAKVRVNLNSDFCNASQTFVDTDEDDGAIVENVDVIANLVWESMD